MIPISSLRCSENREFLRKLWDLAIPVSIQAMMFSLLGLIDILMVGRLGETSVAAVGLGNRIFFFNLIVTAALGGGLSVLASQFIGAGDEGGLRRTLCQALITSLVVTAPFIAAYMLIPEQILALASSDAELLELATTYMLITAPSIFCTAIVVPLEAALRSSNDTKTPTRVGFYMLIVNVVLNYLLIFGSFGFPAMGVAGSAWGTAIARVFQLVVLVLYIRKYRRFLIPLRDEACRSMKMVEILRYYKVTLPVIFQDSQWAFGVLLYSLIYARIGVNELAVMSAISTVEGILMSLFIGFGIGSSIILGQELGARQYDKVWRYGRLVMLCAPAVAVMMSIPIIAFRNPLVSLFGQFDQSTLIMAGEVMLAVGLGLVIKVTNFTGIIGVLRSGGDINTTLVINMFSMWCVGLPLAWIAATQWDWPLYMVFVCSLSEEFTKVFLVLWRIASKKWLRNLVSEPEAEQQEPPKIAA